MKLLSNKMLMILLILVSGYGYIIGCTHDNEIPPPPPEPELEHLLNSITRAVKGKQYYFFSSFSCCSVIVS